MIYLKCKKCGKERGKRRIFCGHECYWESLKEKTGNKAENFKHGMVGTAFYKKWNSMRNRCRNKSQDRYPNYGGRGIKVCERWNKFVNFRDDMYESYVEHHNKHGHINTTLDRIDTNKDYFKHNCKWSTISEQMNNRTNNINVTYKEKTLNLKQWSKLLNIKYGTLRQRITRYGWSIEKAFNPKPHSWRVKKK